MRIMYLTIALLMVLPASAAGVPDGFAPFDYPLANGLILHGWSDSTDDPLQTSGERHYGLDLSIVNDVTQITASRANPILSARYRTQHSLAISGEGPTLPLDDLIAPFSAWHSLPIAERGRSLSLKAINYFDAEALDHDATTQETFPGLTYDQLRISTVNAAKKWQLSEADWLAYATLCGKTIAGPCSPYVKYTELEIIVKDASPVTVTFHYIPGC